MIIALGVLAGAIVGAAAFYLVLRNNPKLAEKVGIIVDVFDGK